MPKDFDPRQAAARGYTREDWDAVDSPELTDEELAALRPMREALPETHAALTAARKREAHAPEDTGLPPVRRERH